MDIEGMGRQTNYDGLEERDMEVTMFQLLCNHFFLMFSHCFAVTGSLTVKAELW